MIDNFTRAASAEEALACVPDAGELSPEEQVTDLLANLMHYCDQEGVDFDACLSMATFHYEEEKL